MIYISIPNSSYDKVVAAIKSFDYLNDNALELFDYHIKGDTYTSNKIIQSYIVITLVDSLTPISNSELHKTNTIGKGCFQESVLAKDYNKPNIIMTIDAFISSLLYNDNNCYYYIPNNTYSHFTSSYADYYHYGYICPKRYTTTKLFSVIEIAANYIKEKGKDTLIHRSISNLKFHVKVNSGKVNKVTTLETEISVNKIDLTKTNKRLLL